MYQLWISPPLTRIGAVRGAARLAKGGVDRLEKSFEKGEEAFDAVNDKVQWPILVDLA